MAAADPTATARLVAAWPAVAFAVAFELLLEQRRPDASEPVQAEPPAVPAESTRVNDVAPAVEPAPPTAPLLPLRAPAAEPSPETTKAPAGTTKAPAAAAGECDELADRAAALIAASDGRGPGRRALARELGCTEHRARTLLGALATNCTMATTKGEG